MPSQARLDPAAAIEAPLPSRWSAREALEELLDPGSFVAWDADLGTRDLLHFDDGRPYSARLDEARRRCGTDEALVGGEGRIHRHPVAVGAFEFDFLGGGMGCVVGERIARLFDTATKRALPVVLLHRSGGARMQEGTWSLFQMAKVCAAIARHRRGRQPYVSVLGDPCMGGTLASSGALGDVILAERGARIGFAGPRVMRETIGVEIPPDLQLAETLLRNGFVDRVVEHDSLRDEVARILAVRSCKLSPVESSPPHRREPPAAPPDGSRMDAIKASRDPRRPRFSAWVEALFEDFFELHGDRLGGEDPALRGGLARLGHLDVMVIGTERGSRLSEFKHRNFAMPRPAGYRKARRLLDLAEKLGIPVLTLVDTPGADSTPDSERGGQAFAIAETIARLVSLSVPVVGLVFGEGGSGGAIAVSATDHLIVLEHAHLSVISPEGCAAILWRSRREVARAAEVLRSTARDLACCGLADSFVPESRAAGGGLAPQVVDAVRKELHSSLLRLLALDRDSLLSRREARLRRDRAWIDPRGR